MRVDPKVLFHELTGGVGSLGVSQCAGYILDPLGNVRRNKFPHSLYSFDVMRLNVLRQLVVLKCSKHVRKCLLRGSVVKISEGRQVLTIFGRGIH